MGGLAMIGKSFRLALFFAFSLGCALPASAGWLVDLFTGIGNDIKERQQWPDQYLCQDRQAVQAPFDIMIANGWQRENTLGDYHFDSATNQLNEAGRLKVQWILTQAPMQHRAVFVHKPLKAEELDARMKSVQDLAGQIVPSDSNPSIVATDVPPLTSRGDWIDNTMQKYKASNPSPRIPAASSSAGGSGGQQTSTQ
jgi:hypothetical protein